MFSAHAISGQFCGYPIDCFRFETVIERGCFSTKKHFVLKEHMAIHSFTKS